MRPNKTLCAPQIQRVAFLSTSSTKAATALERQGNVGQLTASGQVRKEVPLPSQEKKEGAMQYVLYVAPDFMAALQFFMC